MFEIAPDIASGVLSSVAAATPTPGASGGGGGPALKKPAAAALAVGLGALGTGIAQRGIGAAAVGAVAEDSDMFVRALIFTALPETLIIIAFVTLFVG